MTIALGQVYLWRGGRRMVRLGKQLGEGASGKVYTIDTMPGFAAKLYHGPEEAARYETKVEAMLNRAPELPPAERGGVRHPQIAWPEAKIYDREGVFIGFLMPEIDFARSTSLVNLLQRNSRRVEKLSEYYGYRVLVARNLASIFVELHRAGHHMIDMKPANLRFYPEMCWMAVVDADGFSISGAQGRIAATQLSDEYIAPESWKKAPSELGIGQDLFALAAIIFQLLNNGVHPFAGTAAPGSKATDLQARILEGLYPYALDPKPGLNPSTASVHRMLRRSTREMFDNAFLTRRRPTAEDWRNHLDELLQQLTPCAVKPGEHAHFGAGCGFCGHDARVDATRAAPRRRVVRARPEARPQVQRPRAAPAPRIASARRGRSGVSPVALLVRGGAATALFALVALGADAWMQQMRHASEVQAATAGIVLPAMPARVSPFPVPRAYLILPADGASTLELREGPGPQYPIAAAVDLDDELLGRGVRLARNGTAWLWVTRQGDGVSGYVDRSTLVDRDLVAAALDCPEGKTCSDADVIAGERALGDRYRRALGAADAEGRRTLQLDQDIWEEQRRRCNAETAPIECRVRVNSARLIDLETWGIPIEQRGAALGVGPTETNTAQ